MKIMQPKNQYDQYNNQNYKNYSNNYNKPLSRQFQQKPHNNPVQSIEKQVAHFVAEQNELKEMGVEFNPNVFRDDCQKLLKETDDKEGMLTMLISSYEGNSRVSAANKAQIGIINDLMQNINQQNSHPAYFSASNQSNPAMQLQRKPPPEIKIPPFKPANSPEIKNQQNSTQVPNDPHSTPKTFLNKVKSLFTNIFTSSKSENPKSASSSENALNSISANHQQSVGKQKNLKEIPIQSYSQTTKTQVSGAKNIQHMKNLKGCISPKQLFAGGRDNPLIKNMHQKLQGMLHSAYETKEQYNAKIAKLENMILAKNQNSLISNAKNIGQYSSYNIKEIWESQKKQDPYATEQEAAKIYIEREIAGIKESGRNSGLRILLAETSPATQKAMENLMAEIRVADENPKTSPDVKVALEKKFQKQYQGIVNKFLETKNSLSFNIISDFNHNLGIDSEIAKLIQLDDGHYTVGGLDTPGDNNWCGVFCTSYAIVASKNRYCKQFLIDAARGKEHTPAEKNEFNKQMQLAYNDMFN